MDCGIWTYVGNWTSCSHTCGHGTKQRSQRCDGPESARGLEKTAIESCNCETSCYSRVRNNSTVLFDIILDLTNENTARERLLSLISSAILDYAKQFDTTVLDLSILFNTRQRREGTDPSDYVSVKAMFTMEKLVETTYVRSKI